MLHVDGTDIAQWADRLDCRSRLPELIRRLVLASVPPADLRGLDMPSGEGVQKPGVDGRVISTSPHPYVVQGTSIWEFGSDKTITAKANLDYEKRKATVPPGVVPSQTTYVFITPRRWNDRHGWVAAKRAEGVWADVRALDADDLEQWVAMCPAVAVWLAKLLGKHTAGVLSVEEFWEDWSLRTNPPFPPDAVLAGRASSVARLEQWISEPPSTLAVTSESTDEMPAFVAAYMLSRSPPQREPLLSRAIVVANTEAIRESIANGRRLIIIVNTDSPDGVARAAGQGHHLVIRARGTGGGRSIKLERIDAAAAARALKNAGMAERDAARATREAKGKLSVLRRACGDLGQAGPLWTVLADLRALIPLLLAGGWNDTWSGDTVAISTLSQRPYSDVLNDATRYAAMADAPVKRTGNVWTWLSPRDGWEHLASLLNSHDLDTFHHVAVDALSEFDPKFELPVRQQMTAALRGTLPRYSALLRTGIAETVAVLATNANLPVDLDAAGAASRIVRDVLDKHGNDWRLWASLDELLPVLAEASPDDFLDVVENKLLRDGPAVAGLMSEPGGVFAAPLRTGLLWALETLAWSSDHLARSTRVLARLAAADRGGAWANRPSASLREIFLPWKHHTSATTEQRIDALDALIAVVADVGFDVALSLLPQYSMDSSMSTREPRWRAWNTQQEPTPVEEAKIVRHIEERLPSWAGTSSDRWARLVPELDRMSSDARHAAIIAVNALAAQLDDEHRVPIWKAIRELLSEHREFPDAGWVMKEDPDLRALDEAYEAMAPADPTLRLLWLFEDHPKFPSKVAWEQYEGMLELARATAVTAMLGNLGHGAIIGVSDRVVQPWSLGWAIGRSAITNEHLAELLIAPVSSPACTTALNAAFSSRMNRDGYAVALQLRVASLAPQRLGELGASLPFNGETWDLVESWGPDSAVSYWLRAIPHFLREPSRDGTRAVQEFLRANRPHASVYQAAKLVDRRAAATFLPVELIALTLESAAKIAPTTEPMGRQASAYDVGQLFDVLVREGLDTARLSRLEWAWFQVLRSSSHHCRTLFEALANDAKFFHDLIALVFRGAQDEPRETTEDERARAHQGWQLLNDWRRLPGVDDHGGVDAAHLKEWVVAVREHCRASGRTAIGDEQIGEVLAHSPAGTDGHWPHEAVRDVIEAQPDRENLMRGFHTGTFNRRGVFSKAIAAGGEQERALASRFAADAKALTIRWPVTATALRELARSYETDATREDLRADLTKDEFGL